eukprot:363328-Prymnesium_polylepis.1
MTVKFNGRIIVEPSAKRLLPSATWEAAARDLLAEQASAYASTPLQVHLYPNADYRESDRVS